MEEVPSTSPHRPRILLAGLDPIFEVGMARAAVDGGAEVVEAGCSDVDALVRAASEARPDAIIFGDGDPARAVQTGARLRAAAPKATLVLWRHDALAVGVLVPGERLPRVMPAPAAEELCKELFGRESKGEACRPT
jgi:hypothetical protein